MVKMQDRYQGMELAFGVIGLIDIQRSEAFEVLSANSGMGGLNGKCLRVITSALRQKSTNNVAAEG